MREVAVDLAGAAEALCVDRWRRHDVPVEDDRELLVAGAVRADVGDVRKLVEEVGAGALEREVDDALAARRVNAGRGDAELVAVEQDARSGDRRQVRPDRRAGRAQMRALANGRGVILWNWYELQQAGRADQLTDRLDIRDARDLNHDAVAALGLDDWLGNAVLVDAVLDDRPDRRHVVRGDRMIRRPAGPGTRRAGRPEGRGPGACRCSRRVLVGGEQTSLPNGRGASGN